jgi:cation transport ATPase
MASRPAGPSGGQVPCSGCGAIVDPLRAGHVAILAGRFRYFCDAEQCRPRFVGSRAVGARDPRQQREREQRMAQQDSVELPPAAAEVVPSALEAMPAPVVSQNASELIEPIGPPVLAAPPRSDEAADRRELALLLVALAAIAGALTMALEFAAATRLLLMARLVLLVVGCAALMGRAFTLERDRAAPHGAVLVAAPLAGTAVAGWALLLGSGDQALRAGFLAGTVLTSAALGSWLVGLARRPIVATRRWLAEQLDVSGTRLVGAEGEPEARELALEFGVGDQLVVEAGETVPVDLVIDDGEVEVVPWVGALGRMRRRAGDAVVAGATVVQGQLRGTCTWAGADRALARPLLSHARRSDVGADLPRMSRRVAERGAPLLAIVAAVVVALLGGAALDVAMVLVAVYAAFGNEVVASVAALAVARGVREALARGVVVNSAEAWERCGRVTAAVFCARGTLLKGEPELIEVEVFHGVAGVGLEADEVLGLAAGALRAEPTPAALALRRAAREKGIAPDAVRNPRSTPGVGVTAIASTGETLCVGGRSLMLERRISVAAAEQTIADLESHGRTVVLVARADRLVGVLALQDGIRSGARAAVQLLLDAKIEPVLMSSDSRETCVALGRSLDIDHLRPEVAPEERVAAIERIRDTGANVAVLGHSPHDDEPLMAADASVALAAAGRAPDEFSVSLVSDDVRDAALSLALAHGARQQASQLLALVLGPAVVGSLVVTIGLLPPEYVPMAALLGAVGAVAHLRSLDH